MDKYFWVLKINIVFYLILYFGYEKLLKGKKSVIDIVFYRVDIFFLVICIVLEVFKEKKLFIFKKLYIVV